MVTPCCIANIDGWGILYEQIEVLEGQQQIRLSGELSSPKKAGYKFGVGVYEQRSAASGFIGPLEKAPEKGCG